MSIFIEGLSLHVIRIVKLPDGRRLYFVHTGAEFGPNNNREDAPHHTQKSTLL